MPPHTALIARASGSGYPGSPSKPCRTSSSPIRDSSATPFHRPCPYAATAYPSSATSGGKPSAGTLVSCRQTTSGLVSASHSRSRGSRALTEFTFQVAKRIRPACRILAGGQARRAGSAPAAWAGGSGCPAAVRAPDGGGQAGGEHQQDDHQPQAAVVPDHGIPPRPPP